MDISNLILSLIILLFSAILHEIAHGAVAEYFGDDTARMMGRITLNPLAHIDVYYSILLPLLLALSGLPILGAAKPVPVNYNRLRNFRWGVFWVSLAGVLTNIFIAFAFSLPLRFFSASMSLGATKFFTAVVVINIYLAVINLIPIPPIDGSKVLASLLGEQAIYAMSRLERLGMIPFVIFIIIFFGTPAFQHVITPVLNFFFRLFGIA